MKIKLFLKNLFLNFLLYIFNNLSLKHLISKSKINYLDNIKRLIFNQLGAKIETKSYLRSKSYVLKPENLIIGKNVTLGFNCRIINHSVVKIGDNTEIGENLYVITNDHVWNDENSPLGKQGIKTKSIEIGKGVYIGSNVTILSGVKISDNVVIGASSLVNKDLESGFLYCGVPAKQIKPLFDANKN